MFGIKQKSYGNRYQQTKVRVKMGKRRLLLAVIILLTCAEIALGVLWLLGY